MKIIDTFIFYNELDLLNYRLSILDEYIDYFIIVESTHTFSGHKKELYYNKNKINNKIIHIIVEDFPYKYPNIDYNKNQQWNNEAHQRNCIKRGIDIIKNNLNSEDIILTSDVDEIPDPKILIKLLDKSLKYDKNNLNKLALDMYYYNLNFRVGEGQNWHGIKLFTYKSFLKNKLTFQQMRIWEHSHKVNTINFGGWHLSYFGDLNFIINKVKSFSHQEYNNDNILDKEKLEKMIKEGINFHGGCELQTIGIKDNNNLPYKYDIYLINYF